MPKKTKEEPKEVETPPGYDPNAYPRGVGFLPGIGSWDMGGANPPASLDRNKDNPPPNWQPRMMPQPMSVRFSDEGTIKSIRKFTAAEEKKDAKTAHKKKVLIYPRFWQNPYQYWDYIVLQDLYANSLAGRIVDIFVHYILGEGVKPELELRKPDDFKDEKARAKELEGGQSIIDKLKEIDEAISVDGIPNDWSLTGKEELQPWYFKTTEDADDPDAGMNQYMGPISTKWEALLRNALVYGRSMLYVDAQTPLHIDGKELPGIPSSLKLIHPRDMGFNYVDPYTHRLRGLQLHNSNWIVTPTQMVFCEHIPDSPVFASAFYGFSFLQSMIGSARSLRRLIEVDFPLIAKTRWSGMYWIFFKRKGQQQFTAQAELDMIKSQLAPDGINMSLEDVPNEDVRVEKIDLRSDISGLIQMAEFLIRYMLGQSLGMPKSLIFDEEAVNRATQIATTRSYIKTTIKKKRDWFCHVLTQQWYGRNFRTLYGNKAEFKKFKVVATVEEMKLESWVELIEAFTQLLQLGNWKKEAIGDFLGVENYEEKLDPENPEPPGQGQGYTVTPQGGGQGGAGGKIPQGGKGESGSQAGQQKPTTSIMRQ